jgi:hypothetical protein
LAASGGETGAGTGPELVGGISGGLDILGDFTFFSEFADRV